MYEHMLASTRSILASTSSEDFPAAGEYTLVYKRPRSCSVLASFLTHPSYRTVRRHTFVPQSTLSIWP